MPPDQLTCSLSDCQRRVVLGVWFLVYVFAVPERGVFLWLLNVIYGKGQKGQWVLGQRSDCPAAGGHRAGACGPVVASRCPALCRVTPRCAVSGVRCSVLSHFARLPRGSHSSGHTPSTAYRHLPPNSARFSYATEGATPALSPRSCPPTRSAPSESFGY